jgi:hypothetical protein
MLRATVEGYAGQLSYEPGDVLTVHCTAGVPRFDVEIARCGRAREVVWRAEGIAGAARTTPADVAERGCGWPPSFELELPPAWRPGLYQVRFAWAGKDPAELDMPAFFALRAARTDPARSPILLVLATNTYNAYNDWGGPNLYTGGVRVSFERPLAPGFLTQPDGVELRGAVPPGRYDPELTTHRRIVDEHRLSGWCFSGGGWFNWERRFVAWAEQEGIELDYAISSDLEFRPEVLEGRTLVLSVGHDEYWSWGMRDSMEAYVAAGGNAAFMSGNAVYWQVRYEDDGRTMVGYKYDAPEQDPVRDTDERHLQSGMWSDFVVGRPENRLTGVSFTHGGYARSGYGVPRGSGGYTTWRPDHWIFAGTGLRYGDLLGAEHAVVGYEADGCELTLDESGLPVPTCLDGTPDSFEILATAPARLWSNGHDGQDFPPSHLLGEDELGDMEYTQWRLFGVDPRTTPQSQLDPRARKIAHGNAVMGVYTQGGTVFTTGCTDWAYGLAGGDAIVQQMTRNVIARLGA